MIGNVILEKRRAAGFTQAQLANRLGVTAPAVNRWEKNLSYPDVALLAPLARALNTDLNDLFSFYQSLSDEERYLAKDHATTLLVDGENDDAYSYMDEMLHQNPADGQLYLDFAGAIMATTLIGNNSNNPGRLDRLIDYYEKAMELLPERTEDIAFTLVSLYGQKGDRTKAEVALSQIPERKHDKMIAHAELLHALGHEEAAGVELQSHIIRQVIDLISNLALLEAVNRASSRDDLANLARSKQTEIKDVFELWDGVDIIGLLSKREASQANDGGSVEVPLSELLSPSKSGGHLSKSPLFHDAIVGGVPSQDASTADLMADVISALKELK